MRWAGFDIETGPPPNMAPNHAHGWGLQPWRVKHGAIITTAALATSRGAVSLDAEQIPAILQWSIDEGLTLVGWNVAFDMAWLIAYGWWDLVRRCNWLDGRLLYKHLFNNPSPLALILEANATDAEGPDVDEVMRASSYGLEDAAVRMLGVERWKSTEVFDAPRHLLQAYNQTDATHTLATARACWAKLTERQRALALQEAHCLPEVARANAMGLTLNPDVLDALQTRCEADMARTLLDIQMTAGEGVTAQTLASPMKLARLLYEDWQLPVQRTSERTGAPSTDKASLAQLAVIDPRANTVRAYRKASVALSKFVHSPRKSLDYLGGRQTYPQMTMFGTYTGRATYSSKILSLQTGVAIHQWMRDADFRAAIEAPDGYTIVEHDFAGQEFRWMAVFSGDPTMIELCADGEDPHSFMGARIAGEDYRDLMARVAIKEAAAKSFRQLGKVGNLSLQYRTSAATLRLVSLVSYDLPLTMSEAQRIWRAYRASYPKVQTYWSQQCAVARSSRRVYTAAGRRVIIPAAKDRKQVWASESTAINAPIQGSGADQKYLGLACVREEMHRCGARLMLDLHDGLYFLVPDDRAEEFAVRTHHILSNLPYKAAWGLEFPVSFPVDTKWGKTWGDLKEMKL